MVILPHFEKALRNASFFISRIVSETLKEQSVTGQQQLELGLGLIERMSGEEFNPGRL
jgi:hypothetical protein